MVEWIRRTWRRLRGHTEPKEILSVARYRVSDGLIDIASVGNGWTVASAEDADAVYPVWSSPGRLKTPGSAAEVVRTALNGRSVQCILVYGEKLTRELRRVGLPAADGETKELR